MRSDQIAKNVSLLPKENWAEYLGLLFVLKTEILKRVRERMVIITPRQSSLQLSLAAVFHSQGFTRCQAVTPSVSKNFLLVFFNGDDGQEGCSFDHSCAFFHIHKCRPLTNTEKFVFRVHMQTNKCFRVCDKSQVPIIGTSVLAAQNR